MMLLLQSSLPLRSAQDPLRSRSLRALPLSLQLLPATSSYTQNLVGADGSKDAVNTMATAAREDADSTMAAATQKGADNHG